MKNKIEYEQVGDYFIPKLSLPEQKPVGLYGRRRMKYLAEFDKVEFDRLVMKDELNQHLVEINQKAFDMIEQITEHLLKSEPAPDVQTDPMGWAAHMNGLRNRAEEIVLKELIYA